MAWELWIILGLALLIAEVLIPLDFFLFFIGISCVLTAAAAAAQAVSNPSFQWVLAAALTLIGVFGLRPRIRRHFQHSAKRLPDVLENEEVTLTQVILPGEDGRAEARGTSWIVRNLSAEPLAAGQRCRVSRRDGLTLIIE